MGGAIMFCAQRGQNLPSDIASGNRQCKRDKTALADFDVGVDLMRQGVDSQSILPMQTAAIIGTAFSNLIRYDS
jgi:hypothetical protein